MNDNDGIALHSASHPTPKMTLWRWLRLLLMRHADISESAIETLYIWPIKKAPQRYPTEDEVGRARHASERLTEAELRAIAAVARSDAYWPGLLAYHYKRGRWYS